MVKKHKKNYHIKALGLNKVNVKTFHALGKSIISDAYKKKIVMSDLHTRIKIS